MRAKGKPDANLRGIANRFRSPLLLGQDYNNGKLLDGLDSMRRAISHNMFH